MNVSSRPSHTTVKADENVTSPSILKRSIVLGGHKTSVSLEDEFWISLRQIAGTRRESLSELIGTIDAERKLGNLSSAIRMFVLGYYRDRLDQAGGTSPFPSPMA